MGRGGGRVGGGVPSPDGARPDLQRDEGLLATDAALPALLHARQSTDRERERVKAARTQLEMLAGDEAELLALLHAGEFTDREREQAEAARARLERLAGDEALVARLRGDGFAGRRYALFTAALAGYGLPVTIALIRRGEIFTLVAGRNRAVEASADLREHLAGPRGRDDREELASETVAVALRRFRQDVLLPGRWSTEGGATLNTFFVGACLLAFPNVFRAWRKHEYEPRRHLWALPELPVDTGPSRTAATEDPAMAATNHALLADALALATDDRVRQAVFELAVLGGREYQEMAADLDMSEDALKQALSRYRRRVRDRRKEITGD